ncbi:hypothetical protein [Hyphomicrobium sp. LHD-15]|uniref:hypothetical protein n=1 Tax=Hyphomicrobium sp. LHD-15 TaxID=3072142 RepID=UPI00280F2AB2|nr:hypothetical protein [Hyphomicrobium sp. LHD-15]MDQ8700588.1 hypothetical protein [Hyphomicrobium sp. LHD-15]
MTVQLGEALKIEVCGRAFHIPFCLRTLQRAEWLVGPVAPWAERLEHKECKLEEIARMYAAILEVATPPVPAIPSLAEIDEWIFKKGLTNHDDLSVFLFSLTMGREEIARTVRWNAERRQSQ